MVLKVQLRFLLDPFLKDSISYILLVSKILWIFIMKSKNKNWFKNYVKAFSPYHQTYNFIIPNFYFRRIWLNGRVSVGLGGCSKTEFDFTSLLYFQEIFWNLMHNVRLRLRSPHDTLKSWRTKNLITDFLFIFIPNASQYYIMLGLVFRLAFIWFQI